MPIWGLSKQNGYTRTEAPFSYVPELLIWFSPKLAYFPLWTHLSWCEAGRRAVCFRNPCTHAKDGWVPCLEQARWSSVQGGPRRPFINGNSYSIGCCGSIFMANWTAHYISQQTWEFANNFRKYILLSVRLSVTSLWFWVHLISHLIIEERKMLKAYTMYSRQTSLSKITVPYKLMWGLRFHGDVYEDILWDATRCSLVNNYRCFGIVNCFHLQSAWH
jgi:hypothetical protein